MSMYENIENYLEQNCLAPIRYSYKEIKKMAAGFKAKLGEEDLAQSLRQSCAADLLWPSKYWPNLKEMCKILSVKLQPLE